MSRLFRLDGTDCAGLSAMSGRPRRFIAHGLLLRFLGAGFRTSFRIVRDAAQEPLKICSMTYFLSVPLRDGVSGAWAPPGFGGGRAGS